MHVGSSYLGWLSLCIVLVLFLDHWSSSRTFGLGLGLEEKVLQFLKTFVVIPDGSEQGTLWHFVRDNFAVCRSEVIV